MVKIEMVMLKSEIYVFSIIMVCMPGVWLRFTSPQQMNIIVTKPLKKSACMKILEDKRGL